MKSELIFEIVGPEFRRKSFGKFIKEIAGLDSNFEKMLEIWKRWFSYELKISIVFIEVSNIINGAVELFGVMALDDELFMNDFCFSLLLDG